MKRILALDYGTKWIGLASGDTDSKIAFPKGVFENKGFDSVLSKVAEFCDEWGIASLILGLPHDMRDGSEDRLAPEIRKLAERLEKDLDLKVEFVDESLSTFEADKFAKQGERKDDYAAKIILERYFDSLDK